MTKSTPKLIAIVLTLNRQPNHRTRGIKKLIEKRTNEKRPIIALSPIMFNHIR